MMSTANSSNTNKRPPRIQDRVVPGLRAQSGEPAAFATSDKSVEISIPVIHSTMPAVEPVEITITIPPSIPVSEQWLRIHCLPQHVDVRLRTEPHKLAMRRLYEALDRNHARLADGKPVYDYADAVRWMLERFTEEWNAKAQARKGGGSNR
jgi:hypothetical protein